ncbi:calcium-binding protein [Phenylobacterium sp.]|jgi:Ca2+-binding RTX toxin-like protein|uniref:calcium-binding protein n=1 Tax=Phenylobacterium sp. TaxID=1871053 RepID=UPI002E3516C8|nr:calcium-binding protein [Phenylobacterium sp.]HEX2559329.1 calcium-binding protein [Phenylobacterium sp.]
MATSFTFYGVVESVDPTSTPNFQYATGDKVQAHLTLTGEIEDDWEDAVEDESSIFTRNDDDIELTFDGHSMFITDDFFLRSNGTDLSIVEASFIGAHIDVDPEPLSPPGSLFFRVNQFESGGARLIEQEGNGSESGLRYGAADISGAWIPDDIDPNLIYGTDAGQVLKSKGEVSMIWAFGGNDTVQGSNSTYAWGGAGNDSLRGSGEEDQMWGGLGDDTVAGRGGADMLNGLAGNDLVQGGDGEDTLAGGQGNDSLTGGAEDDYLDGGFGNDTLRGEGGDDTLIDLEGADSLDGGTGDDILQGAALRGGGGEDVFRFYLEFGPTVVHDFQNGTDQLEALSVPPGVDVLSLATQVGSDVQFAYNGQTFLTVKNILVSQLDDGDFVG